MHGYRDAYHIGYQYQITVAIGLIGSVFPLENEPEHQRCAERREGINLCLYCRVPECVAPCESQRSGYTAAKHCQILAPCHLCFFSVRHHQTAHQVRDGPKQKQYGKRRQDGTHHIHCHRHLRRVAHKVYHKTRSKHKNRVSGWVSDFKFIPLRDKFRAVPETCCWLQREQIGNCCYCKHQPPQRIVD